LLHSSLPAAANAATQRNVDEFAKSGLRTLVITSRTLGRAEFEAWHERFREALSSIEKREERVATACEAIEHALRPAGVTAIEDRLQVDVAETIATLRQAGLYLPREGM